MLSAGRAAIDRYLLSGGPTAAVNPPQRGLLLLLCGGGFEAEGLVGH